MAEEEKHFTEWIGIKETLHTSQRMPRIHEGEVYWCSFGENVGVEINGKSVLFTRPVIVCKKLSRYGFIGIPLTSQKHEGSWYVGFKFHDKEEIAVLSQLRAFSVSRLHSRMGRIDEADMSKIKHGLHKLLCED